MRKLQGGYYYVYFAKEEAEIQRLSPVCSGFLICKMGVIILLTSEDLMGSVHFCYYYPGNSESDLMIMFSNNTRSQVYCIYFHFLFLVLAFF